MLLGKDTGMKTRLVMVFKSLSNETEREQFLDELLQAVESILSDAAIDPQNPWQSKPPPYPPAQQLYLN